VTWASAGSDGVAVDLELRRVGRLGFPPGPWAIHARSSQIAHLDGSIDGLAGVPYPPEVRVRDWKRQPSGEEDLSDVS
jgi:hypothetical protein